MFILDVENNKSWNTLATEMTREYIIKMKKKRTVWLVNTEHAKFRMSLVKIKNKCANEIFVA